MTPLAAVRPDRFAVRPMLRLLSSAGPDEHARPLRLRQRARSGPPLMPLLPVVYRGNYLRRLLAPRRPAERALLSVIQETYLAGASTRTIDALAETIGVAGWEPASIEKMARQWDERVEAFIRRPLDDSYPYLMVADTPALVREGGKAQIVSVIVVVGISKPGSREVVGLGISGLHELEGFWRRFFEELRERGLSGVQVATSDQHEGLVEGLAAVFPGIGWQRCREDFLAEALAAVPREGRPAVEASLRTIFADADAVAALKTVARIRERFEFAYPELMAVLEKPIGALLTHYQVEPAHRRLVCSFNTLAPMQRELRQACRLIGIFPNRRPLLRLAGTILQEVSDEWAARARPLRRPAMARAAALEASASQAA